jgi:DNA-binding transcriptional LysR family regulator
VLKIGASVAFGTLYIAPLFADFLARCPEVKVDMTINDRIAKDPGLSIVARKLAPGHRNLRQTRLFRASRRARKVADLAEHNCLSYIYVHPKDLWRFQGP